MSRRMMRIVTYGGAVSLDGFLAGVDGSIDWLNQSKDAQKVITEFFKDVDTILMGRKTYDFAVASGREASTGNKKTKGKARKEPPWSTYVFSRTLHSIDEPGVELVKEDAVEFVRNLKQRQGKKICLIGGGELAQPLLEAGLVDQIGLNVHPILLGSGIPTFRDLSHRVKLTLTECRQLEGGCVLMNYNVLPAK
jgi:dihydrofolate reductase